MNIKKFVLFIMLIFLILISCSKSTEPDKHSSNITGYVYDAEGIPVPDVAILMDYNLEGLEEPICNVDSIEPEPPPFDSTKIYCNYPNPFSIATTIMFYIAEYCDSVLWIEDFTHTDTIRIFDIYLSHPGNYVCAWNARDDDGLYVENGEYWVYLSVGETVDSIEIFCSQEYNTYTNYHDYACKIFTNEEGKFEIFQEDIHFENYFPAIDCQGCIYDTLCVSRYVKLWAFSDYYIPVFVDSVYVDPEKGAFVELQFED